VENAKLIQFCMQKHFQGCHAPGKVMENDRPWKSHGIKLVMEKSWNKVSSWKSHGKNRRSC